MSKVDISSEAVERLGCELAAFGCLGDRGLSTLRAQAERIKELEHFLAQEKKIAEKDHGVWCDNYAALDRRYKTARNDALRDAADALDTTSDSIWGRNMREARRNVLALIEGATNDPV